MPEGKGIEKREGNKYLIGSLPPRGIKGGHDPIL